MGSVRGRIGLLWSEARGRVQPHTGRRRRAHREVAQLLLAACVVVPLVAVGVVALTDQTAGRALLLIAGSLILPFGALVAFVLLDRIQPGRAPWAKAVAAALLSAPAAVYGVVDILLGRGRPGVAVGTVAWAEMPNDEDHGATSKVRPVVVVADQGGEVVVRWFTSQDKSSRHDYVEFTHEQQRQCGLEGMGHSTWLSTQTRPLPRSALREAVGSVPPALLQRRPR